MLRFPSVCYCSSLLHTHVLQVAPAVISIPLSCKEVVPGQEGLVEYRTVLESGSEQTLSCWWAVDFNVLRIAIDTATYSYIVHHTYYTLHSSFAFIVPSTDYHANSH
jgi:hypothetical protein